MAKSARPLFFCGECGYESAKWLGKCPGCGSWNTLVETSALPLSDIYSIEARRSTTGMQELDRVLGGGIAHGMAVLLGGDPGIGKSTLLLQAAGSLAQHAKVLYVSGEESPAQIKLRAERLA